MARAGLGQGSEAGGPRRRGRVLLSGASGLIGVHALEPLLESGHEIHALSRHPPAVGPVTWHQVDLLDDRAMRAAMARIAPEYMLHLAWETEHGRFWHAPANLDWAIATLGLLEAFHAAGGRRVVVAGTCAEYDWSTPVDRFSELADPGRQATPERPATLYGVAKQATHTLAAAYAREVGLSLAWGRVFLLYGPGEDTRRLVPSVARALLAGEEAPTTDGGQIRDFMHVTDVARGFVALLLSGVEGPVNVASGEAVEIAHVLDLIARAAGRPDLLRLGGLPRREGEPERIVADVRRLRHEVGFRPRVGLSDGIAATVESLRGVSAAGRLADRSSGS